MGLRMIALAQLSFSLMNVTLELLDRAEPTVKIPILQILCVRMSLTFVGSTLFLWAKGVRDPFWGPPKVRRLLIARGICGFFALFAPVYYSVGWMTLSDSTALTFLTPFCTGFFGHIFLAEPFERRETLAAFASLVGVLLITRPSSLFGGEEQVMMRHAGGGRAGGTGPGLVGGSHNAAIAVSMLGVAGAAAAYTIIIAIGKRAHAIHTVAYYSGACCLACLIEMIVFRVRPVTPSSLYSFNLLLISGALGFLAQSLLSVGLQGEKAGRGSLVMYLQIIFGGVVDRLAFSHIGKPLPWQSLVGSIVILLAAIFGTFAAPPPTFLPHPPYFLSPKSSLKSSLNAHSNDLSYDDDDDDDNNKSLLPQYSPTSPKLHHPHPLRFPTFLSSASSSSNSTSTHALSSSTNEPSFLSSYFPKKKSRDHHRSIYHHHSKNGSGTNGSSSMGYNSGNGGGGGGGGSYRHTDVGEGGGDVGIIGPGTATTTATASTVSLSNLTEKVAESFGSYLPSALDFHPGGPGVSLSSSIGGENGGSKVRYNSGEASSAAGGGLRKTVSSSMVGGNSSRQNSGRSTPVSRKATGTTTTTTTSTTAGVMESVIGESNSHSSGGTGAGGGSSAGAAGTGGAGLTPAGLQSRFNGSSAGATGSMTSGSGSAGS